MNGHMQREREPKPEDTAPLIPAQTEEEKRRTVEAGHYVVLAAITSKLIGAPERERQKSQREERRRRQKVSLTRTSPPPHAYTHTHPRTPADAAHHHVFLMSVCCWDGQRGDSGDVVCVVCVWGFLRAVHRLHIRLLSTTRTGTLVWQRSPVYSGRHLC